MTTTSTEPIRWQGDVDGRLVLLDQTKLPRETTFVDCRDVETVWEAIKQLRVRGAPAIGIAAAYGVVVGLQTVAGGDTADSMRRLDEVAEYLADSRPTAVNLFWALDRMKARGNDLAASGVAGGDFASAMLTEARAIHEEDRQICRAIGRHGADHLDGKSRFLTHCNAGGLATAEYGTALAVFFTLQDRGQSPHVFVDETRPLLQGARLTAWELMQRGIDATLICDSMAAQVMKEGRVEAIVTGADRIAANGDTANKIGTYSLATLAAAHDIPFYIAAPISTFDLTLANGAGIPIEERSADEITNGFGRATAPDSVAVYNPAFDVTPARLIHGIFTEVGVISPVTTENVAAVAGGDS
jgi:methylthioribose-1-phosphate isomerase